MLRRPLLARNSTTQKMKLDVLMLLLMANRIRGGECCGVDSPVHQKYEFEYSPKHGATQKPNPATAMRTLFCQRSRRCVTQAEIAGIRAAATCCSRHRLTRQLHTDTNPTPLMLMMVSSRQEARRSSVGQVSACSISTDHRLESVISTSAIRRRVSSAWSTADRLKRRLRSRETPTSGPSPAAASRTYTSCRPSCRTGSSTGVLADAAAAAAADADAAAAAAAAAAVDDDSAAPVAAATAAVTASAAATAAVTASAAAMAVEFVTEGMMRCYTATDSTLTP